MKSSNCLILIGFIFFAVIGVNGIWAKGQKDSNGLQQKDYDANGWYRNDDGIWVQNPNGAIFEQKPEYSANVGISASVPVGGSFITGQGTSAGVNRFGQDTNAGAHGMAAEQANTIDDWLHGRNARIVGDNNLKDGPDRIVNNVRIQTKYWKSYQESVDSCFNTDSSGKYQFRYYDPYNNNKPMQIEVPKDQYLNAVKHMEDRIREGSVRGVTDPAEAKNIIRQGNITYRQSINIGKAGTIDSLIYDAKTGVITCGFAFGISALVDYWAATRNGVDPALAIQSALVTELKVGGITFASSVLAGQLSKMGFNPLPVSREVNTGAGTNRNIPGPLGQQSFEKLLRGNFTYAGATVFVLTSIDTISLFRGRISGGQLFKNLLTNSGAVAGAAAGAAAGTAVAPGPGTAIGAGVGSVVGGAAGGLVGGTLVHTAAGLFIEDDAEKMVEIIQGQFTFLANSYIVTQAEADLAVSALQTILNGEKLMDMFESGNKTLFARNLLTPIFEDIASNRPFTALPDEEFILDALSILFSETASDYILENDL